MNCSMESMVRTSRSKVSLGRRASKDGTVPFHITGRNGSFFLFGWRDRTAPFFICFKR